MSELAAAPDLSAENVRQGHWQTVFVPTIHSVEAGLARQQALADQVTSQSTPALMIWRCQPALLVTCSETRLAHFDEACIEMRAAGWPVLLRKSGGAACPVGTGTVQVSLLEPALPAATVKATYLSLAKLIQETFRLYRIAAQIGPVIDAYCPGDYDLAVEGQKIAGMSQHWFRNRQGTRCVVATASINVEEAPDDLAGVVNQFYHSAGSQFRCNAAALTNMRMCSAATNIVGQNFASTVAKQFGPGASTLGTAWGTEFQFGRRIALVSRIDPRQSCPGVDTSLG